MMDEPELFVFKHRDSRRVVDDHPTEVIENTTEHIIEIERAGEKGSNFPHGFGKVTLLLLGKLQLFTVGDVVVLLNPSARVHARADRLTPVFQPAFLPIIRREDKTLEALGEDAAIISAQEVTGIIL